MKTLIVGASGATGLLLINELLSQNQKVKVIVRSKDKLQALLPNHIFDDQRLSVFEASVLMLSDAQLSEQVKGCKAVVSCLGHNLTFKGMFGHPRQLVTDATKRLCHAIKSNKPVQPVKFILMNTTGNQDRLNGEKVSFSESLVVGAIRLFLPPHADNELAATFLQTDYPASEDNDKETSNLIEWVVIRPDSLINTPKVSEYKLYGSPVRSAIFNAGKTSRINVAHFMMALVTRPVMWHQWRFKMPVIYNSEDRM